MIRTSQNRTSYYQFENLAACRKIEHRIFTRRGGCSRPPFASLNVTLGIGDQDEAVLRNRDLVLSRMKAEKLVFVRQVHGSEIAVLTAKNDAPNDMPTPEIPIADAMITDRPQMDLVIQVADCQSVLLYEPRRRVAANVHCGWRGSIQNIIGRTVAAMKRCFNCQPVHIQAGIGPSLGPCCAEFVNFRSEIPESLWRYQNSDHHFDFWSISRDQLVKAGVPPANIEISHICTRCRTDEFFSYRAENTTGRFAAVIGIR